MKEPPFSSPLEISQELHAYVKRREMGGFVAKAIRKDFELKKEELRKAYRAAKKDPGQLEAKDWETTFFANN